MISAKKLIRMVRNWQKVAALKRKMISLPRANEDASTAASVADKGHFVVYTADGKRFTFPILYLNSAIFRELFRMSEEEFGLQSDGPIRFPCDAVFMDYVVSMIQQHVDRDMEKVLLMSMSSSSRCSSLYSIHQGQHNEQLLACSF